MYELDWFKLLIHFVLKNCDKIMQFPFNFDACPVHSPFEFVYLKH